MAPETRPEEQALQASPAEAADVETPRGTWAILLGYALVLTGLWVYGYIEMLIRR